MCMENIIVFGIGNIFRAFEKCYSRKDYKIIALVDNDSRLWGGKSEFGIEVIGPKDILGIDYDKIIITTAHAYEIEAQLLKMGIEKSKIVRIASVREIRKVRYNGDFELYQGVIEELNRGNDLAERNLFLSAKIFSENVGKNRIRSLADVEFKVFSQFGEDGIIQWLIRNVEIANKTFVEFGASDYKEANTRFLMMNDNWSGLIMEGNARDVAEVMDWNRLWLYDLEVKNCFITRENINELIADSGIQGDIGLLSIDIDGIDYWILESIFVIQPRIIICEYNNVFGNDYAVSVPYDESFDRTEKHYSNLYWGASLPAFKKLLGRRGYYYVGSNSAGNNAFFVQKDCFDRTKIMGNPEEEFVDAKYRESLDASGQWSYLKGEEKLQAIKNMEVVDLDGGNCIRSIGDVFGI